ncbi:DNA-binding transcriptional regulator, LysR family [Rhizobiales bacterium GAS191]|nr:DNA-binding transcriptional regulator, LysR family [Rhizobiales bacterium GAS191]
MRAHYTLRQLRYFTATVEHHGVAQAARNLNISQPAISVAIKNIEDAFDVQLFLRNHPGGVSLTQAGKRFYQHALDLLRSSREFEHLVLSERDTIVGNIEVGCFVTVAPLYMPGLVAGFQTQFPQINVNIVDSFQPGLVSGLVAGRLDLAMMYEAGLDKQFERVPLLPDLMPHALLPRTHQLANRASVSLRELADEPLILLDIPPSNDYFLGLFKELGLTPNVTHRSASLGMVRGLVGRQLGYSVSITQPATIRTCDGNELITVAISDPLPHSTLVMAWPAQAKLMPQTMMFLDFCQKTIGNVTSEGDIRKGAKFVEPRSALGKGRTTKAI